MAPSSGSLLALLSVLTCALGDVMVHEVPVGGMAILQCPSSDTDHRFGYWLTNNEEEIGPNSHLNPVKYRFDVLSGELYIRGVSTAESGFYQCVSYSVFPPKTHKVRKVELIVRRDWGETYEDDTENNTIRAIVALSAILVILLVILGFLLRHRRPLRFRELVDDESPDDPPPTSTMSRGDVYRPTTMPAGGGLLGGGGSSGEDNLAVAVDTDFPTVFQSSDDGRM